MESVSDKTIYQAVEILGTCESVDDVIRQRIRALVEEDITVSRLVDFIAEAFGLVALSHLPIGEDATLPTAFSAQDMAGKRRSFPMKDEPIMAEAIKIAQHIFDNGPRHIFVTNARRSAIMDVTNNFLWEHGPSALEGVKVGLSFDLPASLYDPEHP